MFIHQLWYQAKFLLSLETSLHIPNQPKHIRQTQSLNTICLISNSAMSASMNLEERFEALMKNYEEIKISNAEIKISNEELKKELVLIDIELATVKSQDFVAKRMS